MERPTLPDQPFLFDQPSLDLVEKVVRSFYARVRADETLGPIFERRIGDDWEPHLSKMVDFWSSLTMMTGSYSGRPHAAHHGLGLTAANFDHWLVLFDKTIDDCCQGYVAELFRTRARRVADSLQIGLNIGPHALNLPAA